MAKYEVDPNRGALLLKTSKGWVIARLNQFDIVTDDEDVTDDGEEKSLYYNMHESLFKMALIPEELVNSVLSHITEESHKDITEIDLFN